MAQVAARKHLTVIKTLIRFCQSQFEINEKNVFQYEGSARKQIWNAKFLLPNTKHPHSNLRHQPKNEEN